MTQFNPDDYFASKINSATSSDDKLLELAKASQAKVELLKAYRPVADAIRAQNVLNDAADANSWVGKLGLDPNGIVGQGVNKTAGAISGLSRQVIGPILALPFSASNLADTSQMDQMDIEAYNRFKTNTATPEDMARLNTKQYAVSKNDSPEAHLRAAAAQPDAPTKLELFNRSVDAGETARSIATAFDISSIQHGADKRAFGEDLGKNFDANWNKVKNAVQDPDEAKFMYTKAEKLVKPGNIPIEGKAYSAGAMDSIETPEGIVLIPAGGKAQYEKDGKNFGTFKDSKASINYLQQLNLLASKQKDSVLVGAKPADAPSLLQRGGDAVSGITNLLVDAGQAAGRNKSGVLDYVAENAPQLAVGGLGKVGAAAMAASNVGYAADQYQQGLENFAKENNGQLPSLDEQRTMAGAAASLAIAEQVGDKLSLGFGKAAVKSGKSALLGVAKATAEGFVSEAATEGYQTYAEGIANRTNVSAKDIYTGAVIGGLSGGILSGGAHAIAEMARPAEPKANENAETKTQREAFAEATKANDTSSYMDPKNPAYDPSKAIGVLLGHAMKADTAPEVKQTNLTQAAEIMSKLEADHAKASEAMESRSPEAIQTAKTELAAVQEQLKTVDPQDTARVELLTEISKEMQTNIAELSDSKGTLRAETKLSKLTRQLDTGRARLEGLATVATPQEQDTDVASLVEQVNTNAADVDNAPAADRIINLSMNQPNSITGEQALELADNTNNALTDVQRTHLRAFSAARVLENKLSTMDAVSKEVLYGTPPSASKTKNLGISQYRTRIASALAAGNQGLAETSVQGLEKFLQSHETKYALAAEAFAQGQEVQIIKVGSNWEVNTGKLLGEAELRKNGGLNIHPVKSKNLIPNIGIEVQAIEAAVAEMKSALSLKFGVQSVSPNETALPSGNINSPKNEEETARPDLTVQTPDSVSSKKLDSVLKGEEKQRRIDASARGERLRPSPDTVASPASEPASPALAGARAATVPASATATNKSKKKTLRESEEANAKKEAAVADAIAKQEAKRAATEQQDVVSEANNSPVAEVVPAQAESKNTLTVFDTPVDSTAPYTTKNLIAAFFKVKAAVEGDTVQPLSATKDFLSALKAKSIKISDFIQQKDEFTDAQRRVVSRFMASATAWSDNIKANLVKSNPDFHFEDMIQFLINDQTDLDENVKTAISYAAFSWVAENATRPAINDNEEINQILGRGDDALVSETERNALAHVGTRQNVVVASLGQRAVAALGLKSLASAPRNLQADLEVSIGTHVMKLLMDQGILERAKLTGAEMAALTKDKNTNSNASFYFLKLARSERELNPAAAGIVEAYSGSQGLLDKLFGVEAGLKEPSQTPIKATQKTTRNTSQEIPSELEKIVAKDDAEPSLVRQDMYNLASQLSPDTMLLIAGYEEVTEAVHKSRRASLEAKNNGLARELDRFMNYVGEMGSDVVMHFEHSVWKQQRVGIATNVVNPQTSKIHRHMLYRPSWDTTIDMNDDAAMTNFKLRVSEGMGVKTDKMSQDKALAKFNEMVKKPEVKGAVAVLLKTINDQTDGQLSANDQEILLAGVKVGGENMSSLDALMALAQYTQAKKAKASKFNVQMMAEVDGVTNGPMFSHLLMGAANTVAEMYALLNRGGFFQQGSAHSEYNNWRDAPGNFDLYETTALHMTQEIHGLKADPQVMTSLYAFTGELADSKGVVQKAGRNIIKTPLTAMVFGSSVASAVDSMADGFIESIYAAIEDGTMTKNEILKHLDVLGVSFPASVDLMETEFTKNQILALKGVFKMTLGKAVEATMKKDFEVFIDQRTQFNKTAQMTFELYNAAYTGMRDQKIADLVKANEIAVNAKTGKPLHDLTSAQEREIRDQLKDLAPVMHTPMSLASKELDAGLLVAKSDRKLSTSEIYQNTVKFGQPFVKPDGTPELNNKGTPIMSARVHGYEVANTGPGVAMVPMSMHSADSAVSHRANPDGKALNVHDAQGAGIGQIKEVAENMNRATWDTMLNYSPANEVTEALLRTVRGLNALIAKGNVPDIVMENLAKTIVTLAEKAEAPTESILSLQAVYAKAMTYRADTMKLETMASMGAVNQYAMEGGAYTVTTDNRTAAQMLLSKLQSSLTDADTKALEAVSDAIHKVINGKNMPVVEKAEADPEMDPVVKPAGSVAELGKSAIASDQALVDAFTKTPQMGLQAFVDLLRGNLSNDFEQKLLTALSRATGQSLTVRYVTPETAPSDLLVKGGDKSRGWFVSKEDQNVIYVLSPEFKYSGLTPELLLHELLHAAVAQVIENPVGDQVALVAELDQLRTKATAFITENKLEAKFAPAVESVHELVSWGMSNVEFQQEVLSKVEMQSANGGNTLVNGMKSFIDKLVSLVFGRANATMSSGMEVMITNASGLINAAAKNKASTKGEAIVLNQTNTGSNLRDLSTIDIHDALGNMNSGAQVSEAFDIKLRDLLTGIVKKLHGPYGTFKAALMEQTAQTAEQVYQEALATGVAPFAFEAVTAGFQMTEQEVFVVEQVQVTVNEAIGNKDGVTSVAYRELAKLYDEVRSKIKPDSFYTSATPTVVEIAEANALHAFIFNVDLGTDGKSEYLSRFAALGLANEQFNTILAGTASRSNAGGSVLSFNARLNKIFENILNWFTGKMTNTNNANTADKNLTALVEQLVAIEARKRRVVEAKVNYMQPIEEKLNGLASGLRRKLDEFSKKPFFRASPSGLVRGASALASAYANERTDAIMEGFNRLRDQHFQHQHGIAAALVNEFRGANAGNMVFHFLLRASKFIEGTRKDIITGTGKIVMESFDNKGADLAEKHKEAISAVFLRTDMAALLGTYTMADLEGLVNSPAKLEAAIAGFETDLAGLGNSSKFRRFFSNSAKALGYYKATGIVSNTHMLMNAGNIARMFGTGFVNRITEAEAKIAEPMIDALVSLYALKYSSPTHLKAAREVMAAEAARTDGGNGVQHVLLTHKQLQDKSKEILFDGSLPMHMKGYTTEIYDPYMDVVVAIEAEGADLMARGYTQGEQLSYDDADVTNDAKHIYHLRDGGMKQHLTGVFSYTGTKAKGSRVHNGNTSPLSYAGQYNAGTMASIQSAKAADIQKLFTNATFDPTAVKETFLAPVLNANGDVVNYRYLMSERTKDVLLDRDNRPEKILGALAGSIYDKVSSVEQNRRGVEALHEQYKEEFAERPESYLDVSAKSTDPELREIWRLLPYTTKQAVKEIWGTEGMRVRVDLLDINFGYRKLSVADAFDKAQGERSFVQNMFVEIMEMCFDSKAALRTRQAEDIWQAVVKATKGNLVVKSWSTMSGNLRSNWSQLILMGVNPVKIAKSHRVAFKGAWAYKKDSEELFNLGHQLSTGYLLPGQTKPEIENRMARLKDSLNRNPVKPLIDAGLMPTIVEDVAADEDIYSYKSRFTKKADKLTSKINPHVRDLGKFLLMTEDSSAYKVMSYATQISDFLARYTLYEHSINKKEPLTHEQAVQLASDAFINYDVPTHRMVQYANDSGLVMFTKYYMRIQKMIMKIYKEHPGRVLAMIAAEHMLGDQPTVLDSSMLHRWGNPMNLGALDYPGSLDSLTTVRILTSPFSSGGGNPAD